MKKVKKPKWMPPKTYCCYRRPWSAFYVNFYPGGIDADLEELQSEKGIIDWTMYLEKTKKKPTMKQIWCEIEREPENYPVDKELFASLHGFMGSRNQKVIIKKRANFKSILYYNSFL